jgi:MoxR-like ATPase
MGYPDSLAEREILRARAGAAQLDNLRPVLSGADVLEMQDAVTRVRVDDSLVNYALNIIRKTRQSDVFSIGVSPRGSQMLYRAAQASAFLNGRNFCVPEDFKPLVVPVFAHRVNLNGRNSSGQNKIQQAEQLLHEIVAGVAVPV